MNDLVEEIANNLMKEGYDDSEGLKVYYKFARSSIQTILNSFKSKDYGDFENAIDELEKALNDE